MSTDWTFYYNEGFDRGVKRVTSKLDETPGEEIYELLYDIDHALLHEKIAIVRKWIERVSGVASEHDTSDEKVANK
jgi:hypothetical protein